MRPLIAHGMLSFNSSDVLRFFGKRTTKAGKIPANFHGELQTSCKEYAEGERVKFWMEGNSAKSYDKAYTIEGAVFRAAETTINHVSVFKTYRPKEGASRGSAMAEDAQRHRRSASAGGSIAAHQ